jgi:putative ubiquitin-RnfH superfamily antitoxin RatB of RatAB toxin-antitoxin module
MSDVFALSPIKSSASIYVTIVHAHPTHVDQETLTLPARTCVRDALAASTLGAAREQIAAMQSLNAEHNDDGGHIADSFVGVWGRRVMLDALLNDGDRIELYRPVIADAKAARLNRASEQGYRWQARTRRAARVREPLDDQA